jgi:hypothetical protein
VGFDYSKCGSEMPEVRSVRIAVIIAVASMTMLSQEGWAQSDSTKNTLNFSLNFMTQGSG